MRAKSMRFRKPAWLRSATRAEVTGVAADRSGHGHFGNLDQLAGTNYRRATLKILPSSVTTAFDFDLGAYQGGGVGTLKGLSKVLEPLRRQLSVAHRALDELVAQIGLQRSRIVARVSQSVAGGVAQHVRMGWRPRQPAPLCGRSQRW